MIEYLTMTPAPSEPKHSTLHAPLAVYSEAELQALYEEILASGALGRSKVYGQLLSFLLQAARENRQPKEVEIAIDVLGRSTDFDVGKDSVVRVYIHQLRKRLKTFYDRHRPDTQMQLVIPKGQYTIAVEKMQTTPSLPAHRPEPQASSSSLYRWRTHLLIGLLAIALFINAALLGINRDRSDTSTIDGLDQHPMWRSVLEDDMPILLVMGDYYIFGELDQFGRIERMVREFDINSRDDLTQLFMEDSSAAARYRDLDMTYMPEGSAYALTQIAPVLHAADKRMNVTMMSRLSTADLRSNHIIYIGYISALDKLNNLFFAASGLQLGRSYDELFNRGTQEFYSSDAGLPEQGQSFRDIGLLATFPAANNNQFILITGTRDAGVMHSAQVAGNPNLLQQLDESLSLQQDRPFASMEGLYEVFGLDRMNFDANLIYSNELDPARIWRRQEQ